MLFFIFRSRWLGACASPRQCLPPPPPPQHTLTNLPILPFLLQIYLDHHCSRAQKKQNKTNPHTLRISRQRHTPNSETPTRVNEKSSLHTAVLAHASATHTSPPRLDPSKEVSSITGPVLAPDGHLLVGSGVRLLPEVVVRVDRRVLWSSICERLESFESLCLNASSVSSAWTADSCTI